VTVWFCIEVRFLHERYHGRGGWPPTPLRLFQAITAGAVSGRWAIEDRPATEAVLRWLETLGAPTLVLASPASSLHPYRLAVPNNQADRHVPALRKGVRLDDLLRGDKELKQVQPCSIAREPVIYGWPIAEAFRGEAEVVRAVVRRLVAFGTGLDHAVAEARLSAEAPTAERLIKHEPGSSPCAGTLDSLLSRHKATLLRLAGGGLLENLPPIRHAPGAGRHQAASQMVLALRLSAEHGPDRPLSIAPEATAVLAYAVRQHLASVLIDALGRRRDTAAGFSPEKVERLVLGRDAGPDDKGRRVSVIPLPSVGHEHTDGLLRRVLISTPAACPMAPEVLRRALQDAEVEVDLTEPGTCGLRVRLAGPAQGAGDPDTAGRERSMLDRYVGAARVWRSVSPVVLPGAGIRATAASDPVDRARTDERRRVREESLFHRAIREVGIDLAEVESIRLRREPFGARQPRADAAWRLPKNAEGRRWLAGRPRVHAEIVFTRARSGPLAIGDGRYLGLGLFHGVPDEPPGRPEVARFRIPADRRPRVQQSVRIADVLRRALMSGGGHPPLEFSGHDVGGPLRADPAHGHAFFLPEDADGDGLIDHLVVYCRRGFSGDGVARLRRVDRLWWAGAVQESGEYAGNFLALELEALGEPNASSGLSALFGPSRIWSSVTPYLRPWHAKPRDRVAGDDALSATQVGREWSLRWPGSPPSVERLPISRAGRWTTLSRSFEWARTARDRFAPDRRGGFFRLTFEYPVSGPIALGRSAHFGLGLFVAERSDEV
jgi:CRISPR-associated protein Csb2